MLSNHQKNGEETPGDGHHRPVLVQEVVECLKPKKGDLYLDVTAGYGGHAERILERTRKTKQAVLVDRDAEAVGYLKKRFAKDSVKIIHSDFLSASRTLIETGQSFDIILADLGLSSVHLENKGRGFSFRVDEPLDMRMDIRQEKTAQKLLNILSEAELARILSDYGQEPKARAIAKRIVTQRPISTTRQLADTAKKSWPWRSKVHPATRTFQALRIAVNDELEQLEQSLPLWLELLKPGGRLAVISFHSLEDRIVKQFLKENSGSIYDSRFQILTKKPITPSPNELVSNPRARSAKLRAGSKK